MSVSPEATTNQIAGFVAPWVDEQDRVLVKLAASTYDDVPIQSLDGFVLLSAGTESVRVWTREKTAIVALRGTKLNDFSNLLDDAALAGLTDQSCNLNLVNQAKPLIEDLINQEFMIYVVGHSLGGAAAFCLGHEYPQLARIVSMNGGAPPTNGGVKGLGEKTRFYHIVGDIISTHIDDSTAVVSRIHLTGKTDWASFAWYHSTARFFEDKSFELWSAQREQDSLVQYLYESNIPRDLVFLLTGLISSHLNKDRLKEIVCKNPIPGTDPDCPNQSNIIGPIVGGALGAFGGLVVGGIPGAVAGAKVGTEIALGKGALDIFTPLNKVFPPTRYIGHQILKAAQVYNRTHPYRPRLLYVNKIR